MWELSQGQLRVVQFDIHTWEGNKKETDQKKAVVVVVIVVFVAFAVVAAVAVVVVGKSVHIKGLPFFRVTC